MLSAGILEVAVDGVDAAFDRAVNAHRDAVAHARRSDELLQRVAGDDSHAERSRVEQAGFAAELAAAAAALVPGWLGVRLDGTAELPPLGVDAGPPGRGEPVGLRLGDATPVGTASFPALVPLLGAGHLAVDADARDAQVSGLLRSVVLRLLSACPQGSLRLLSVDGATVGATFAPYQALWRRA